MWSKFVTVLVVVTLSSWIFTLYTINKDNQDTVTRNIYSGNNYHMSRTAPKQSFASRTCSQEERKSHINEMCRMYAMTWSQKPRMFIDDEHRLMFCDVGKTGSSTIKNLLHKSMRNGELVTQQYSHDLHNNYTKFIVVRNPYDRLVSAYNDKFVRYINDTFPLYRLYRLQMAEFLGLKNDWKFVFKDFITYLEMGNDPSIQQNGHWDQYSRCDPCHIKYDYILKTETLGEDIKLILPLINQKYSAFVKGTARVSPERMAHIWSGYQYSHYLKEFLALSKEQIQWLKKEYYYEDVIFGYGLQEMRSYCQIQIASSKEICC